MQELGEISPSDSPVDSDNKIEDEEDILENGLENIGDTRPSDFNEPDQGEEISDENGSSLNDTPKKYQESDEVWANESN
jgi:hypothetical protein